MVFFTKSLGHFQILMAGRKVEPKLIRIRQVTWQQNKSIKATSEDKASFDDFVERFFFAYNIPFVVPKATIYEQLSINSRRIPTAWQKGARWKYTGTRAAYAVKESA